MYAKCIDERQVAYSKEEFISRENEENHVYCVGETTKSNNGMDILYCVPLNFIYDCLKYGRYIAIIDINDCIGESYIRKSSYMGLQKVNKEQKVINILDSYSKETVDFVFNEVKDPELIHDGYIGFLPEDVQAYFKSLKR
jgi:hypothetical protein